MTYSLMNEDTSINDNQSNTVRFRMRKSKPSHPEWRRSEILMVFVC